MKVELFQNDEVSEEALKRLVETLHECWFYEDLECPFEDLKIIDTPEGYDIELYGIEIGSYGIRRVRGFSWIYGTMLAEPRFSEAYKLIKE